MRSSAKSHPNQADREPDARLFERYMRRLKQVRESLQALEAAR